MSEEETAEKVIYFSYRGKRQRQVSKEEWEREWLEWWGRVEKSGS